jgi:hypothetical protein
MLVALATWTAGCSYLFVTPPHEAEGGRLIGECTTDRSAPTVDTLLVTTNALSAIYFATGDTLKNKEAAVALGVGAAAFWLSSAIYGFYNTVQRSARGREAVLGAGAGGATERRVAAHATATATRPVAGWRLTACLPGGPLPYSQNSWPRQWHSRRPAARQTAGR